MKIEIQPIPLPLPYYDGVGNDIWAGIYTFGDSLGKVSREKGELIIRFPVGAELHLNSDNSIYFHRLDNQKEAEKHFEKAVNKSHLEGFALA